MPLTPERRAFLCTTLARWLNEGHWIFVCNDLGLSRNDVLEVGSAVWRWHYTVEAVERRGPDGLRALLEACAVRAPALRDYALFSAILDELKRDAR